jgi:ElaB/YqjD/DUF883 family membrane-anchored ribosome-binding protein
MTAPIFGNTSEWMLNTIKRNPEGLLLLAAGAVLLMRTNSGVPSRQTTPPNVESGSNISDEAASGLAETVADGARRTLHEAGSYASTAASAAREATDAVKSYASSATDYADQVRQKVGEQSDRVIQQTQTMAQRILQDQPLALVAVGLAAGAALAAAFPPTEIERETLGPAAAAAGRFGDQVKRATAKAGEKLKTTTEERGLHVQGLKEVAEEVVETFKESMSEGQKSSSSHFEGHSDEVETR